MKTFKLRKSTNKFIFLQIVLTFLGSIIVPLLLGAIQLLESGPKVLFGKDGKLQWMLLVAVIPFYPFLLIVDLKILYPGTSKQIASSTHRSH